MFSRALQRKKTIILIFRNSSEICAHLSSALHPVTPARLHLICAYKVAQHQKIKQVHPHKILN